LKQPFTLREKIEGMTIRELAGEAMLRTRRRVSRKLGAAFGSPANSRVSDESLRRSLKRASIANIANRIRGGDRCITPGICDLAGTASLVKELFPDSVESARIEADAILAHRITVFDRTFDLGALIDWHRDPYSGIRWPTAHFSQMPLAVSPGADIRAVWELNRLHQLVALGRAYCLTQDERYTEEFLAQLASWDEQNPPRFSVNWVVAMEAAIRGVNIVAALEMFRCSRRIDDHAIELILKMLLAHGRFIRSNLEYSYRAAANHYLSDLIGLFVIGASIPEFAESRQWVSYSAQALRREFDRQVLPDGVSYEGAVGYHRLVLEIFALSFTMSRSSGTEITTHNRDRFEAMFDFVRHYLKPDGTAPMIGDSDDGRLLRFKPREADDHSYLLSLGAVVFEDQKFKQSDRIDEEALWWFGSAGYEIFERVGRGRLPSSKAFPKAKIFIQRAESEHGSLYGIIDCGDHGTRGRGSHAHSDALSIDVFALGRTWLRDPGTFVYTASAEDRDLFRSTAYHNTVRIDREEISETRDGWLFAFGKNVRPKVNAWQSDSEHDLLDAEHYSYHRLAAPVTHRRIVTLDKREGRWTIEDIFTGEGHHFFEFFFNLDAGLRVTIDESKRAIVSDEGATFVVAPSCDNLQATIEPRWVSPAFKTRISSSAIIYSLSSDVPLKMTFDLSFKR
jgi:hypothetical protein